LFIIGLSVNVCCISSISIVPEEEWLLDPLPVYYNMRVLTPPTLLDWASSSEDDDDDDVSLLQSTAVVREQSLHETAADGGEEHALTTTGEEEATGGGEEVIAAGMENIDWERDYHHAETLERCGEDYTLEEYFETIALSHPGYAAFQKELPKAVFRK